MPEEDEQAKLARTLGQPGSWEACLPLSSLGQGAAATLSKMPGRKRWSEYLAKALGPSAAGMYLHHSPKGGPKYSTLAVAAKGFRICSLQVRVSGFMLSARAVSESDALLNPKPLNHAQLKC